MDAKVKRNRRLLLKTAKRIEEFPASYDQGDWGRESNRSPCGAVACLAGEIVICSERTVKRGIELLYKIMNSRGDSVADAAIRLSRLDYNDDGLFYDPKHWPAGIGKGFYLKSQTGKAKAAAELLRYLAAGGEV